MVVYQDEYVERVAAVSSCKVRAVCVTALLCQEVSPSSDLTLTPISRPVLTPATSTIRWIGRRATMRSITPETSIVSSLAELPITRSITSGPSIASKAGIPGRCTTLTVSEEMRYSQARMRTCMETACVSCVVTRTTGCTITTSAHRNSGSSPPSTSLTTCSTA